MGTPPTCCEKVGIKKGPWTPEEDIILVSYVQQHGPGNWSSVPINTGLLRCSKSCRLRWSNYLRPGIKRGNFTLHEQAIIIHLQALLGNKWAAIASYLPQRTDNDIKNYWNTHLKKKLHRFQLPSHNSTSTHHHHHHQFMSKNDRVHDHNSSSSSSMHASSAENISRLLEKWMGSSSTSQLDDRGHKPRLDVGKHVVPTEVGDASGSMKRDAPREVDSHGESYNGMRIDDDDRSECILSFDDCGLTSSKSCGSSGIVDQGRARFVHEEKRESGGDPPLSFLEEWLMDETVSQVEGDIGSICKL